MEVIDRAQSKAQSSLSWHFTVLLWYRITEWNQTEQINEHLKKHQFDENWQKPKNWGVLWVFGFTQVLL